MNSTDNVGSKRSSGAKGDVTVFEDAGRLKVNLPRSYFGGKQLKRALNLKATDENWAIAYRIARRMTLDLQDGCFDTSLEKYGVKANLKLVAASDNLPPQPKLGTLEIWDKYLEYKKPTLKETIFLERFQRVFTNAIVQAIDSVGDDAVSIRTWLLSNRCLETSTRVLGNLSYAYQLSIKQGLITVNPFAGMADELPKKTKNQKVDIYDDNDSEQCLYDNKEVKKRAFTVTEVNSIIDYVNGCKGNHYCPILQFLFLTGCRTNEATALMWGDVKWDKEYIVIQRSYSPKLKKFVSTKTGHIRLFPMPKDGILWQMLKSLNVETPNQVVFKSKTGKVIDSVRLSEFWRGSKNKNNYPGVIPTLIQQGKISKYLPLYNTRHTFISYQINECGIPPHVVKDWCGHSEDMTTNVYRQEDLLTKPISYDSKPIPNQPSELSRVEVLEQQVQLLMEQNKMLQEIIVNLETRSSTSNATIATDD